MTFAQMSLLNRLATGRIIKVDARRHDGRVIYRECMAGGTPCANGRVDRTTAHVLWAKGLIAAQKSVDTLVITASGIAEVRRLAADATQGRALS